MSDRGQFRNNFSIFYLSILIIFASGLVNAQVKVMPVGNSITAGKTPAGDLSDGFRGLVKDELGANYVFVGDDITVTPGLNGHFKSGAKIDNFLENGDKYIVPALNAHNPEIVLLHIGTNNINPEDAAGPYTVPYTPAGKLRELINTIARHQSVSSILVCKIIPKLDANMMTRRPVETL